MQSTDLEESKAALWEQAYHPCTQVSWGMAQVMAARSSKGQLLVQLRGRVHWYRAEAVTGDQAEALPNRCLRPRRGPLLECLIYSIRVPTLPHPKEPERSALG
jgi:hypothetical protein